MRKPRVALSVGLLARGPRQCHLAGDSGEGTSIDILLQDIRYAWRSLLRARGMTVVAVFTMGIAIGAVVMVFSFVNSALLRPLPYPDADRIVALTAFPRPDRYWFWNSMPLDAVRALRTDSTSFERVGVYREDYVQPTFDDQSFSVARTAVDTAILKIVGAQAARGRMFTVDEIIGMAPVALVSDSLWRTRFGSREDILSTSITIRDTSYRVIGVLQPGFRFAERSDIWVPLVERPDSVSAFHWDATDYHVYGKLRTGVSVDRARATVTLIGARLAATNADYRKSGLLVQDGMISRNLGRTAPLAILPLAVAICLLLIACVNVGNLFTVRAAERRSEMAVRASLGATGWRLARQLLAESAIVGVAAGALGVVLSVAGTSVVLGLFPTQGMPAWVRFGTDASVAFFAFGVTIVAVMAFGITPAKEALRVNLANVLKSGGDAVVVEAGVMKSGRRGVVLQLALSLMLCVGALLCFRSYGVVSALDTTESDKIFRPFLTLDDRRYPQPADRIRAYEAIAERLAAMPGVSDVQLQGPFNASFRGADTLAARRGRDADIAALRADDRLYTAENSAQPADLVIRRDRQLIVATDGYLRMFGRKLTAGRGFDSSDVIGAPLVAVISERIATVVWAGANPVGRSFRIGPAGRPISVIGVVQDVRRAGRDASGSPGIVSVPEVFLSARQALFNPWLYIRPASDEIALDQLIRQSTRGVDPSIVVQATRRASDSSGETGFLLKMFGGIVGGFSLAGVFLALIGIYAVIAYGVTQRTREIGLRIALGAAPNDVVTLFVRQGIRLAAIGVSVGVLLAAAGAQGLRFIIVGVSLVDPMAYAAGVLLFTALALVATWLPARRAARVEPLTALRSL